MQEAGSVVSLVNPISGNHINFSVLDSAARIINAGMQEFADGRVKYCNCDVKKGATSDPYLLTTNPFATGEKGNWYPTTTWSYLTNRVRSDGVAADLTNVRVDGVFSTYSNFWNYITGINRGGRGTSQDGNGSKRLRRRMSMALHLKRVMSLAGTMHC